MGFPTHTNYFLTIFIIVCSFCAGVSFMNDTITSTRFLKDPETISSNSSNLKLGFFTPENSTHRYVAIWYLSHSYIVWIANRDQPLNDSSGVFKIHKDGNLVVLNSQNSVIWSTNVSTNATNTSAQLDDSGNLILHDVTSGTTIWDSFSHPLDAGLAGMKIAVNRITGKKFEYVSWKSSSDPSSGYFSASLERLDAPEVFFWYKTKPYWRTGPWNGTVFLGSPKMLKEYLYGWSFVPNENGLAYLTYKFEKPSMFGILSITPNGTLKLVEFMNRTIILKINQVELNKCEFYGTCGPFGSCDITLSPICTCFKGFEPSNPEEWKRENWTSGCKRNMPLNCGLLKNVSEVKSDGFLTYHNMKVPDFVERLVVDHDQDNCKADCLANCSCLAYAYDSYIGCMYWRGDLIDLQKFSDGGVDLFIRLPEQLLDAESKKGTEYRGFIIGIAGAIGALILAISAYLFWRKSTPKHTGSRLQNLIRRDPKQIKLDELPIFEFEKLAISTNNFHSNNMLGKGGFGPVYKGQLENGQEIAVKRLSKASGQGLEEFMNEVVVISKLQHRNLVRLLGCCIERDEQMLIYEFMPNKSLDSLLFDSLQRKALDWKKCFNIIEGVARGILYLHRDSRLRIIHRDLKASNVLLDAGMNPKISDFGLARIVRGDDDDEANTRRVVGTYGYMSPEYAMEGIFSEKSDVYSFGVLLLEILSGRRNTSFYNNEQSLSLVGYAWKLWNEGKIMFMIDQEIQDPVFEKSMVRCIHIGLLCVQELAKERPTISSVVLMLISEITHLPPPRQVAFVQKQNCHSSESSQKSQFSSNNNVTLTDIQGR